MHLNWQKKGLLLLMSAAWTSLAFMLPVNCIPKRPTSLITCKKSAAKAILLTNIANRYSRKTLPAVSMSRRQYSRHVGNPIRQIPTLAGQSTKLLRRCCRQDCGDRSRSRCQPLRILKGSPNFKLQVPFTSLALTHLKHQCSSVPFVLTPDSG